MIKAKFSLFQMQIEHLFSDPPHLVQSKFGISPERLNTIDLRLVIGKLITSMLNPEVFRIPHIDKTVILSPAVRVDNTLQAHLTPYNMLQRAFFGIRNNFRVDPPITFKDTKDNGFTAGSTTPFSTHPLCSKIGFINLKRCGLKSRDCLKLHDEKIGQLC